MSNEQPLKNNSVQLTDYHIPVLLHETIASLQIKPEGIYVDCTFGGGGHSRMILQQLGPQGKLIAFDQDADAKKNLPNDERVLFVPQNFRHLKRFLKMHDIEKVDGILADLGVSSHQFDEPDRGFSYRFDAALDMRMDQRQTITAADVVGTYSESQLQLLFQEYGEVTNAKTLAKVIVEARSKMKIISIQDFKQAIQTAVKGNPQKYFAQVFQALRIQVNDEMGALKELLQQTLQVLKPSGRLAIITFHSLEDRIVKNFFKADGNQDETSFDLYGTKKDAPFEIINKKPVVASNEEMKLNPRSRSAKLRVVALK
jgi:16S rRNA (cytosine1402-N4)-methyltransferase